ncbi:MAG: hypothetical protein KBT31_06455 [Firmicutes bacterium]|nr:hypothetical protein [Candidatus Colimorpha enterica]
MKNSSSPEKWLASEIRSDFPTYKSILSNLNRNIGISLINNELNAALPTIQQLIDSFELLKEQLYCEVNDIMAAYYWLNGMVIACGVDNEVMRKKVADANFELAYRIAGSGLRSNISKIREVVSKSTDAKNCNNMLQFFDDEDNYLGLLYQQEQNIMKLTL